MPTRVRSELKKFRRSLQRADNTRSRMERLFLRKKIKKTDLDSVYEALFLRAVTSFESFLEELFLAILERRTRYRADRVKLLMTTKSRDALMTILLQGDSYMTWLPYVATEERAKLYLAGGRPFSDLDDGDKSLLKTITIIRNAIAHRGSHAMSQFREKVVGSQSLLPNEKKPAGYLRSQIRGGRAGNRFEMYVGELGKVAGILC